jgi:hypothetical protein
VPPPESARISTRHRSPWGSWASASRTAPMWSAAVSDPAFPGGSMLASGSPEASALWSATTVSGWRRLLLLRAGSHNGGVHIQRDQPATCSRGNPPGQCAHPLAAAARAVRIALGAAGRSPARRLTRRDTTGSEAAGPNNCGCARSIVTSARQSPPSASASTRSATIFPGSCTARGGPRLPSRPGAARWAPSTCSPRWRLILVRAPGVCSASNADARNRRVTDQLASACLLTPKARTDPDGSNHG